MPGTRHVDGPSLGGENKERAMSNSMRGSRTVVAALAVCCLAACLGGCTPRFLNPMITKETAAHQPGFAGSWRCETTDEGAPTAIVAEPLAIEGTELPEAWMVKATFNPSKGDKNQAPRNGDLFVGFVKVGDHLFANITTNLDAMTSAANFSAPLAMSVFSVARVKFDGDTFTYEELKQDWMDDLLKKDDRVLEHVHQDGGGVLISASGEQQREFFKAHGGDAAAWQAAKVWKRNTGAN